MLFVGSLVGDYRKIRVMRVDRLRSDSNVLSKQDEEKIRAQVEKLKAREREVIAHENAHKAVAGRYAGLMRYTYTRGPDGKLYISGGEVSLSTSEEQSPEATIRKMQIIRAAALAPADPSPQDLNVARTAMAKEIEARAELAKQLFEKTHKPHKKGTLDVLL